MRFVATRGGEIYPSNVSDHHAHDHREYQKTQVVTIICPESVTNLSMFEQMIQDDLILRLYLQCILPTWRIIPFSKWLITMTSKSPNWENSLSKWSLKMAYKWGHHPNQQVLGAHPPIHPRNEAASIGNEIQLGFFHGHLSSFGPVSFGCLRFVEANAVLYVWI